MSELVNIALKTILPSRSFYQLKHFVVGQHDTPEMRYRQILIEIKDLLFKMQNAELEIEKTERKIKKLEASSEEIDHIKARQKKLGVVVTRDALESAKYELDCLLKIAQDYCHYDLVDIERNQEDYWKKRLTRQAQMDRLSAIENIDTGNLASIMQAGLIQKEITV